MAMFLLPESLPQLVPESHSSDQAETETRLSDLHIFHASILWAFSSLSCSFASTLVLASWPLKWHTWDATDRRSTACLALIIARTIALVTSYKAPVSTYTHKNHKFSRLSHSRTQTPWMSGLHTVHLISRMIVSKVGVQLPYLRSNRMYLYRGATNRCRRIPIKPMWLRITQKWVVLSLCLRYNN